MNPKTLKGVGIGCFVLSLILAFVAFERYQANASNVAAAKQFMGNFPMGDMLGVQNVSPGTPTVTKYALFFALLSAGGGVACFVMAPRTAKPSPFPGPGALGE